jgi:hypothetical protein
MAAIANAVISRASTLLLDVTGIRWPATELLIYLCDGQREAASIKPNIYVKFATPMLAPGPRQSMPADARELRAIARNVNGAAIRPVSRDLMDAHIPNWYAAQAKSTVQHTMYTDMEPLAFYVFPPQPATGMGSVEMSYYAIPADIGLNDALLIPDTYIGALVDYILYRAFSKDSEYAANAEVAQGYLTSFTESLAGKAAVEKQT